MSDSAIEKVSKIVKILGSTIGRDRVCKVVQYLALYLCHSKRDSTGKVSNPAFEKVHYNMWMTRKLLRFGLLWDLIKQIKLFTDPMHKDEQGGSDKLNKSLAKSSNPRDLQLGQDSDAKKVFDVSSFDTPGLKALSKISDFLFCISDIPFFFKEMKVLDWTPEVFNKLFKFKHMFWICSLLFLLARDYILLKAINLKVARIKKYTFPEGKMGEKQKKEFDCKLCFNNDLVDAEIKSLNQDYTKLLVSVIRTLVDISLPLHYLGMKHFDMKTVGIIGTISGVMSFL